MTADHMLADYRIHKAVPGERNDHCAICGQRIRSLPGGQGGTFVHADTGAVAAPNPDGVQSENTGRFAQRSLTDIMEFDHVIRVHCDGQITSGRIGAPTEPDTLDGELFGDSRWSMMNGYSGQDRYSGPVMHNSEFIGGGMEIDIRAAPGLYVALVMHWSPKCMECDQDAGFEENEISHHLDADGNIDHNQDADHVALIPEDDVEGWVVAFIHDDPPNSNR